MDGLKLILEHLASPATVREAELQLDQTFARDPTGTLVGLAHLGNELGTTPQDRAQALILGKRLAFRVEEQNHGVPAWPRIDSAARTAVQAQILKALAEADHRESAERHIACDVACVIYKAYQDVGQEWPELLQLALDSVVHPSPTEREVGFLVLAALPDSVVRHLSVGNGEIIRHIASELQMQPQAVQTSIAAFNAACALISEWPDGVKPLWPAMMETLLAPADNDSVEEILELLIALLGDASTIQKLVDFHYFRSFVDMCAHHASSTKLDVSLRASWIEGGVTPAESASAHCLETQHYQKLLLTLLQLMSALFSLLRLNVPDVTLAAEVSYDSQWLHADTEAEDNDAIYVIAESAIDRFAQVLDNDAVLSILLPPVQTLVTTDVWQHKHAALSAIAVLAEGCSEPIEPHLGALLKLIQPCFTDPHPRVRHAALYALAQLSSYLDGAVQSTFAEPVLQILYNALGDPEARLKAWAAAAIINFFDVAVDTDGPLKASIQAIYERLFQLASTDSPNVRSRALEAIASLALFATGIVAQNYVGLMPLLRSILSSSESEVSSMQVCALECAAQAAVAAGPVASAADAEALYKIMQSLLGRAKQADDETTAMESLSAMVSLTTVASTQALPYLPNLTKDLLDLAVRQVDVRTGIEDDDRFEEIEVEGRSLAIDSNQLECKAEAIDMLRRLYETMRGFMLPYVQPSLQAVLPLLKFKFGDVIRRMTASLFAPILLAVQQSDTTSDELSRLNNHISSALIDALGAEDDPSLVASYHEELAAMWAIKPCNVDGVIVNGFITTIARQLQNLLSRCDASAGNVAKKPAAPADDLDDEALLDACSRAIKAFISLSPSDDSLEYLTRGVVVEAATVPGPLADNEAIQRWAMRFVIDMIVQKGDGVALMVSPLLPLFYEKTNVGDAETRCTRAVGIGMIAQYGHSAYNAFLSQGLQTLSEACVGQTPSQTFDKPVRDRAISAVAKILRFVPTSESFPYDAEGLVATFVDSMPVELDADETANCYALFLELIARGHKAVNPAVTSIAEHVIDVLTFPLQGINALRLPDADVASIRAALSFYVASTEPSLRARVPPELLSELR